MSQIEPPFFIPSVLVDQLKLTTIQVDVSEDFFWLDFKKTCVKDEYHKVMGNVEPVESTKRLAEYADKVEESQAEDRESFATEFFDLINRVAEMPMVHLYYEKRLSLVTDKEGNAVGYIVTAIVKRVKENLPIASTHLFHPNFLKSVEYFGVAASLLYPQWNAILDAIRRGHR